MKKKLIRSLYSNFFVKKYQVVYFISLFLVIFSYAKFMAWAIGSIDGYPKHGNLTFLNIIMLGIIWKSTIIIVIILEDYSLPMITSVSYGDQIVSIQNFFFHIWQSTCGTNEFN